MTSGGDAAGRLEEGYDATSHLEELGRRTPRAHGGLRRAMRTIDPVAEMTFRIEVSPEGPRASFRLAGRMRSENLDDLEREMAGSGGPVVLDLDDVTLVDVEVVRFLMDAEDAGVELRQCPPFVREWIDRERRAPWRR